MVLLTLEAHTCSNVRGNPTCWIGFLLEMELAFWLCVGTFCKSSCFLFARWFGLVVWLLYLLVGCLVGCLAVLLVRLVGWLVGCCACSLVVG